MNQSPPLLEGFDLELGYRGRAVVDGLNLRIESGTATALVGPNGSGKSTLLMALARVLTPRHGEVRLDGEPIASRKTVDLQRRQTAVVISDNTFEAMEVRTPGPAARTVEHSFLVALQTELGRLGYQARACWWLREVEGLSHDEIATALAISRGSVRGHLQRARSQLAVRLAAWGPDGSDVHEARSPGRIRHQIPRPTPQGRRDDSPAPR